MKITMENVSKIFDDGTTALKDINLVIEEGIFGLLGPNASGKTTLIRILATLSKPTGGVIRFDDMDLNDNRALIRSMTGYLPQRFSTFTNITTREFIDYSARLAGLRKKKERANEVDSLLESLGLYSVRNTRANELSISMKRHLEIAQAVVGNPEILIIDEPTVGLSPEERIRFSDLLSERIKKIKIIIMSTHILNDIKSTCSNLAVLEKGEVAYHGSTNILLEQMENK
ncbi:ATP-binding cassette domain-containing protein [Candidatus Latescibacterota bacterium]